MDQAYHVQVEQAQQEQEEAAIFICNVLLAAGIDPSWARHTYLWHELQRYIDDVKHLNSRRKELLYGH